MKRFALLVAIASALTLGACSKITKENFARIEEGMSEQQVISILGAPTESSSLSVLGVSGALSRWVSRDGVIVVVHFLNGKVAFKFLERPA